MDKMKEWRAELYRARDILDTELTQLEKNLDLLQESVSMMTEIPDEVIEKLQIQAKRGIEIVRDAEQVEIAIMEIVNSGGSPESIEKAERLRNRLNGS